jgi:hypothetical protein
VGSAERAQVDEFLMSVLCAVLLLVFLRGQPHGCRQGNDHDQSGGQYETTPVFHAVLLMLRFGGSGNTLQDKNATA